MLCTSCARLAILHTKRSCIKCQGAVYQNIAVLCDACSASEKTCAACLKKVISVFDRQKQSGCNCGKKK